MSLFRKPKKPIQRRVFSGYSDEEDLENAEKFNNKLKSMDDLNEQVSVKSSKSSKDKINSTAQNHTKTSLLSFDDEDEGEIFQVKKSSHSKKFMKLLDKQRKKKKQKPSSKSSTENEDKEYLMNEMNDQFKSSQLNNNLQTEIRTDDFVLVVKKTEPEVSNEFIMAYDKDDLSSEETDENDHSKSHKFSQPHNFKKVLESGAIPDAAMIHAARKRRQKAREQCEFIPIEEHPVETKGSRVLMDDAEDDFSDEERVDMNAITGIKEREERREKFYSIQRECGSDDSDQEMTEWERQQIRKGVTGGQLVSQQESMFSSFIIHSPNLHNSENKTLSTGVLLEQAYAKVCLDKPRQILLSTQHVENKPTAPRMPIEVLNKIKERLYKLKEINDKHYNNIDSLNDELKSLKTNVSDCERNAVDTADKYQFYQEMKCFILDLIECLDEKIPQISELEKKTITIISKRMTFLIERRRQDVRDQAKEIAELSKTGLKKYLDDADHTRRAAEREGRRTRRRRDRERNELNENHLEGMSSDDEVADADINSYKTQMEQIMMESEKIMDDITYEFREIDEILKKFEAWKKYDIDRYNEAYVTLCLPKIIGPYVRLKLLSWNPLDEQNQDIEKMNWYNMIMKYGYDPKETESTLIVDPDIRFLPAVIEKIILPKITEYIENCWDPLSTTQTLKLVGLIGRLGREYPSLRPTCSTLKTLFSAILDKMKLSLDNDVFIPIFPKHIQDAKKSFFQRQFSSGLKLFRNLISWQGLISDSTLKDIAILSLLNRYLLSAMRVCTVNDAIAKAYIIVNTLPRVWLNPECGILESLDMFILFLKNIFDQLSNDKQSNSESIEKLLKILYRLHANT